MVWTPGEFRSHMSQITFAPTLTLLAVVQTAFYRDRATMTERVRQSVDTTWANL